MKFQVWLVQGKADTNLRERSRRHQFNRTDTKMARESRYHIHRFFWPAIYTRIIR